MLMGVAGAVFKIVSDYEIYLMYRESFQVLYHEMLTVGECNDVRIVDASYVCYLLNCFWSLKSSWK